MKYITYLVILLLFLLSMPANSAQVDGAKVTFAGTYGNGRLFVQLDKSIPEPGCENSRFDVTSGHTQIQSWLSIAMTAVVSGKTVKVSTNGCLGAFPTMNSGESTWFYLKQN